MKIRKFTRNLLLLGIFFAFPILLSSAAQQSLIKNDGVVAQEGKIDVAFLGSSAIYRYIIPQMLWKEDGITSCLIGKPAQPFDDMPTQIAIAMQGTAPSLFVIEIRRLIMNDIERKSEKPDKNQYNGLQSTADGENWIEQLFGQLNWPVLDQNAADDGPQNLPGEILTIGTVKREKQWDPTAYKSKTRPLEAQSLKTLRTVLNLCKEHKLHVLFISTPYVEKPQFVMEENYAAQIIESAGFDYLNYNYDYRALGLNFATDFYDQRHVNMAGAVKMTNAMAAYLKGEQFLYGGTASANAYWENSYRQWANKAAKQQQEIQSAIDKIWR